MERTSAPQGKVASREDYDYEEILSDLDGGEDSIDLGKEEPDVYSPEDRYVDDTRKEAEGTPLNVEALTLELKTLSQDIRINPKYKPEERDALLNKISDLLRKLKPFKDGAPVPKRIASEVSAFEAKVVGDAAQEAEGNKEGASAKQIDELKTKVQGSKMPDDLKTKIVSKIESQKGLGEEGDVESLAASTQEVIDLYEKHSPAAIRLTQQLFSGSSEESAEAGFNTKPELGENLPDLKAVENLEALAKKHNIDLANPPTPPGKNMIEFLQEASPDLAGKMKEVKEAADQRMQEDQKDANDCKALNATRSASTTGPVEESAADSAKPWQSRYDRKYYQDKTSRGLVESMESAKKEVENLLGSIYPNQIGKVEPVAAQGWQVAYNRAMAADKIFVGGAQIDLFNNTDGSLNVTAQEDQENIKVDTVEYDNEGDGKWKPGVNGYGDDVNLHDYDDGGSETIKGAGHVAATTATGAASGAATGAAIGYFGGPMGMAAGASVGAVVGAVEGVIDEVF